MDKIIIGAVEIITVFGNGRQKKLAAKIDTGASKSSIDAALIEELGISPIMKTKIIKSASGISRRLLAEVEVMIRDKRIKTEFTIADRMHLRYPVLIGLNTLEDGFLIDPSKR